MPIALSNEHVEATGDDIMYPPSSHDESSMDIAIIGMACRLPGHVSNLESFWDLCLTARDTWSEVPKERFSQEHFYHPNPDQTNCWYSKGGHFLSEDLARFDAQFFNITAQEAKAMDPQQRLLLECAYEALENAGISMQSLIGQDVGSFVGTSQSDYHKLMLKDTETMPTFIETGNQEAILSARLSYFFGLRGPCFTVDTACSSGLTALHLACQSLRSHESKQAIVGGSHVNLLPDALIAKSNIRLLSSDGRSFAFDDRSNGYGPGEGTGVLILKPLDDAIRDGDPVRAVIRNTGINQDGRTQGMTMPSEEAQRNLARATYEKIGLDPGETTYVEAHGTGTAVGDPIETRVIQSVFGKNRSVEKPLYLGSVKSNIGHLEGASGIVSVIKTTMMLEKGVILPNSGFAKGNPNIPSLGKSLVVATSPLPWPETSIRRASVSNFGFGGSNAHVILEEPPHIQSQRQDLMSNGDSFIFEEYANEDQHHLNSVAEVEIHDATSDVHFRLFLLTANDRTSLDQQVARFKAYLSTRSDAKDDNFLCDLAFTLGQRRSSLPWKVAYVADSLASLVQKLETPDINPLRSLKAPQIGFVFTGQGAQWYGMGRELLVSNDVFASAIDAATRCIIKHGASYNLRDELMKDAKSSCLGRASISQPACTAIQIALVLVLRSWGIRPTLVTGHSSGEIAAAFATEALSLESCMAIAYHRGVAATRLQEEHPETRGAMLALGTSESAAITLINEMEAADQLVVACVNSPSSVTISGDAHAIDLLQTEAARRSFFNRKLNVDVAYHSHHLKSVSASYRSALKGIRPAHTAGVQFVSSLTGVSVSTLVLGPSYWVSNLVSQVKFLQAIQEVNVRSKVDLLIEIGPHSALQGPVSETLSTDTSPAHKIDYLPSLKRNHNASQSILRLASELLIRGCAVDMSAVNHTDGQQSAVLVDLPTYPWNHEHAYWHETRLPRNHRLRKFGRSDILGAQAVDSNDIEPRWRNIIELNNLPWLRDHKVQSDVVCPMTFFLTMAIEAAHQHAISGGIPFTKYVLREVNVGQALVIPESAQTETVLNLRPLGESTRASSDIWHEFIIFSWNHERGWMEHCRGQIAVQLDNQPNPVDGLRSQETAQELIQESTSDTASAAVNAVECERIYETFTSLGLEFGPSFHNLVECRAGKGSVYARVRTPNTKERMPYEFESEYIIHPGLLDSCFQVSFPIFTEGLELLNGTPIASRVKEISISRDINQVRDEHLEIYGKGVSKSLVEQTIGSILATRAGDDRDAPLISVKGFTSTTLSNKPAEIDATEATYPCWKMEWQLYAHLPSLIDDDVDLTNSLTNGLTRGVTNGLVNSLADGHAANQADGYTNVLTNGCTNGITNGFDNNHTNDLTNGRTNGFTDAFTNGSTNGLADSHTNHSTNNHTNGLANGLSNGHMNGLLIDATNGHPNTPTDSLTNGHTKGLINGLTNGHTNGLSNRHWNEHTKALSNGLTNGHTNSHTVSLTNGHKNGLGSDLTNGHTNSHTDGLTNGHTNGHTNSHADVLTNGHTKGLTKGLTNGHTNGLANSLRNGHTNGLTDDLPHDHENGHTNGLLDRHTNGDRVAAVKSQVSVEVVVVCSKPPHRLSLERLQVALEATGVRYFTIVPLTEINKMDLSNSVCIFLDELDSPILATLSFDEFSAVQKLCSAQGLLWVIQDANLETARPDANMISGMMRTVRNENAGILPIILDLDGKERLSTDDTSDLICRVFKASWGGHASTREVEREYMERRGDVFVPRVVEDPDASRRAVRQDGKVNLELQNFEQVDRPLSLTIDSPGLLDTLYFEDDKDATTPLLDDHVEIRVRATGVNFRDVMYAVGQISSEHFGGECSGTIAAMGRSVSGFEIGDRVCALSSGGYGTFARCSSHLVVKIPDSMSFLSAATIPVIFSTTYFGLVKTAHLCAGETVLIHAAAGGVGQAAIRLCQWIGAEIFVTVGSVEKKRLLMDAYNIPEDHIFNSRDTSFEASIKHKTSGNGVDVVLNSLAGEMLKASLDCLAPFGRFIEIGKKDLIVNTRVEMSKFTDNITYATVDLLLLQAKKPRLAGKVLSEVTDLVFKGQVANIVTINAFAISEVEAAFRLMQSGKSMGKIVVEPREGDQVKAILPTLGHSALRRDASYLITGGTGGVGQSITRWLVGQGAKNIILTSRSGLDNQDVRDLVHELENLGARITVLRCDISNRSQVERLAKECSASMPPIKGVIHGSAVFQNVLLEKSTYEQYTTVIAPKVQGAWNLHHVFANLDFFLMLGSLASFLGNHGQSAYGATSTFLDAFAEYRIAQGLPAATVSLGAVRGAGYFAKDVDTRAWHVDKHLGLQWLDQVEVFSFINAAIRAQTAESSKRSNHHWITGLKPRPDVTEEPFWMSDSKFLHLRQAYQASRSDHVLSGGGNAKATTLVQQLEKAESFEDARSLVLTSLTGKVADVLMKSVEDISPSLPMASYGLDSLVAVEIRNWIARSLDVKVSMFDLISGNSLDALSVLVVLKSRVVRAEVKEEWKEE